MKKLLFIALLFTACLGMAQPNNLPIWGKVPWVCAGTITATTTSTHKVNTTNMIELNSGPNGSAIGSIVFAADTATPNTASSGIAGIGLIYLTDTSGANPGYYTSVTLDYVTSSTTVGPLSFNSSGLQHSPALIMYNMPLTIGPNQKVYLGATVMPTGGYYRVYMQRYDY
jgi:hypothetical protein